MCVYVIKLQVFLIAAPDTRYYEVSGYLGNPRALYTRFTRAACDLIPLQPVQVGVYLDPLIGGNSTRVLLGTASHSIGLGLIFLSSRLNKQQHRTTFSSRQVLNPKIRPLLRPQNRLISPSTLLSPKVE